MTRRGTAEEIDRDELLRKYAEERDKRLREDGNDQYVEPIGTFSHFLDDPYAEPEPRADIEIISE